VAEDVVAAAEAAEAVAVAVAATVTDKETVVGGGDGVNSVTV